MKCGVIKRQDGVYVNYGQARWNGGNRKRWYSIDGKSWRRSLKQAREAAGLDPAAAAIAAYLHGCDLSHWSRQPPEIQSLYIEPAVCGISSFADQAARFSAAIWWGKVHCSCDI